MEQILEDEDLSELKPSVIKKMAIVLFAEDRWADVFLEFTPPVDYHVITKEFPSLAGGEKEYCYKMIQRIAQNGATMKQFLTALDKTGLITTAKKFRKEYVKHGQMQAVHQPANPAPAPVPQAQQNVQNQVLVAPNTNIAGSAINKFVMAPKHSPLLSDRLDLLLEGLGFYSVHKCTTHILWFYPKQTQYDSQRYVIKFLVGELNLVMSASDGLKYASEVLFTLAQEQSGWLEDFSTFEECTAKACYQILRNTLTNTLNDTIPHRIYGTTTDALPLTVDVGGWLADTKHKTNGRFYCCARFDDIQRELTEIEGIPQALIKELTSLDIDLLAICNGSVNVCFSSDTILPVLLTLHQEDIAKSFERKELNLLSIFELSIQDVEDMLKMPKNLKFEGQLNKLKHKMISDAAPISLGDDRWKIDFKGQPKSVRKRSTDARIEEDDYLSLLSSASVVEMAREIGYKSEWKKIGLHFNPEVKYEALKTANPTHIYDGTGDFGYCTLMIGELAKQDVKMKDFLAAVDAVGLKASARLFREKYVLPPGQKIQQNPDAGKNNNNDKNQPVKPEEKEPNFEKEAWFVKEKPVIKGMSIADYEGPKAVPVAIFVVNDIEKNAVLRDFKPLVGKDALLRVKKSGQWYVVGRFGNYDAVLVQTDMGGDSVLSFDRAITDWQVKILIAIGVAWGSEPNKQKLGDVLVAKEVAVYGDNDKAQNGEYNIRSHIPKAGTNILKSLKAFKDEWEFKYDNKQSSVHIGRIISAGLLVNDQVVKTQLLNIPQHKLVDIIGGDMEAKALAHVVSENNLKVQEWVMVKGICDWADGNKHKGYQPLAAAAASDFVKFVLSQPDVLDDIINPN